ncbi:MAG: GGDEF domain-containing protein [Treponema sp.]|nr:GGDEF domain-containing protein [Treponema sp.]
MHTIGVIIPTFTIEYSLDILAGISDFFRDKNVKVLIAQTNYRYNAASANDYQYWASVEYFKSAEVDSVIVVTGVYSSSMEAKEVNRFIEEFFPKPIISIGVDINLDKTTSILMDCKKSYYEVVHHLKKEHGCKKIGFISADLTHSVESNSRSEAFTEAMKKNLLKIDKNIWFDGNFTDTSALEALKARIKSKEDVAFDALVCANDLMACGAMNYLKSLGVKIPEDVKVVGFDDSIAASIASPRLSTINQDIYRLGEKAAEVALNTVENGCQEKVIYIDADPKFRQSCGCISLNSPEHVFKNVEGRLLTDQNTRMDNYPRFMNEIYEKNNIVTLVDILHGCNTLKQIFYNLRYIIRQCDMTSLYISFLPEVAFLEADEDFTLPDTMQLYMISNDLKGLDLFNPEISFNPKKKLFAARTTKKDAGIYLFQPIFSGEKNYGFVYGQIKGVKFADYNVYLKIIVTALARAFDYTGHLIETQSLAHELSDLTIQSRTDDLTGIMNRRGFMERGQACLDLILETDGCGLVFFADMDGLKNINDTYGHNYGDLAIKTQSEVLQEVFGNEAIVGRLSGDEFGIIVPGMQLSSVKRTRLKIDLMNEKYSAKNKLPFVISTSLGHVDLQNSSKLKDLLNVADEALYEEKRKKHAKLS